MKLNNLLTSTGIALTLLISTSAFLTPAQSKDKYKDGYLPDYADDGTLVIVCPKYNGKWEKQAKDLPSTLPLCADPIINPASKNNVIKETSLDSVKPMQQGNKQVGCVWIPRYGWTGPNC